MKKLPYYPSSRKCFCMVKSCFPLADLIPHIHHVVLSASGLLCCAPFLISTVALALSFVASATCDLVKLENTDFFPFPARSAGLWCFQTLGGSTASSVDIPSDQKWDKARGCGAATLVLSIIIWLYYCFAACCPFAPLVFRIVAFLCLCNTVLQGLVFLILQSNMCFQGCELDTAGYCAIAASISWFLTGLLSCVSGKRAPDEEFVEEEAIEEDEDEDEEEANQQEKSAKEESSKSDDNEAIEEENSQEQATPNEVEGVEQQGGDSKE